MPADVVHPPGPRGRPGDFDFLAGLWRIANRRLVDDPQTGPRWDEFPGEATVWRALDGAASIEELRIPARSFSGMGIRLLDVAGARWGDHWVSGRNGLLSPEPMWGGFAEGVGTFESIEADDKGQTIRAKGVWDRITPHSCRWWQATSRDGGATWEPNWFMDWTRVAGPG